MEKNSSLSNNNSLREQGTGVRLTTKGVTSSNKVAMDRFIWDSSGTHGLADQEGLGDGGGDLLGVFSWPPRSYTCTFCKREFRSAQALGGHMNVHRRDRARLRQLSPPPRDLLLPPQKNLSSNNNLINLNLDPNPNPNFSSSFSTHPSSSSTVFPPFTSSSKLPPLISSSPSSKQPNLPCLPSSPSQQSHCLCPRTGANLATLRSQKSIFGFAGFDDFSHQKESKIVDKAEIVRLNLEIGLLSESKAEDLDLELRLGCS